MAPTPRAGWSLREVGGSRRGVSPRVPYGLASHCVQGRVGTCDLMRWSDSQLLPRTFIYISSKLLMLMWCSTEAGCSFKGPRWLIYPILSYPKTDQQGYVCYQLLIIIIIASKMLKILLVSPNYYTTLYTTITFFKFDSLNNSNGWPVSVWFDQWVSEFLDALNQPLAKGKTEKTKKKKEGKNALHSDAGFMTAPAPQLRLMSNGNGSSPGPSASVSPAPKSGFSRISTMADNTPSQEGTPAPREQPKVAFGLGLGTKRKADLDETMESPPSKRRWN